MDLPPTVSHEIARLARIAGQARLRTFAAQIPNHALDAAITAARGCLFAAGVPGERYAARNQEMLTTALVIAGIAEAWGEGRRRPMDVDAAMLSMQVLAAGILRLAEQSARLDEDFATAIFDGFYADDESVDPD